jgi:hypothetical protein
MLNFDWLAGIPLGIVKGIFFGLFTLIGVLVLLLPHDEVVAGVAEPRWWHNLKLWAWGVLALLFATYLAF